MESGNFSKLIESKQKELQEAAQTWAEQMQILAPGQTMFVQLIIVDPEVGATQACLPPDEKEGRDNFSTWHLSEDDWARLARVSWDKNQLKLLNLLKQQNNGPLAIGSLQDYGIVWEKIKTLVSFSKKIKKAGNYKIGQRRTRYYRLERLKNHPEFLAIKKYQVGG